MGGVDMARLSGSCEYGGRRHGTSKVEALNIRGKHGTSKWKP